MAAREVLELAPIYWRQVITEETEESQQRHLGRHLKPHIDEHARKRMREALEPLSSDGLRRLNSAIAFLLQAPPDPHHTALRERIAGKDREVVPASSRSLASKKSVLYALNQHQRRKAKTFPTYDWRSHFWTRAVMPDAHLGKIAFPYHRHNLTPYVFRHALASDFKAERPRLDASDIATVLGHQSTRTQEHYGNPNIANGLSGSRALQEIELNSSTPIRQPVRQRFPSQEHPRI